MLLAVGVGVGLGWVLASLHHDGRTSSSPPLPVETAVRRSPPPASAPALRGRPPAPVHPSPSAAPLAASEPAPPSDVIEFVGPDEIEQWVVWEEAVAPTAGRRGWQALLTLYAMAGRLEDFQRAVPRALEAGLGGPVVLDLLQLLPHDKQVVALDHLLQAFPEREWPVTTVAAIYANAGAGERAVDILVPALEKEVTADLARCLVQAAPDRAARVLAALANPGDWSANLLAEVGEAFVTAQRPDLALTFLQDALAREPLNGFALMTLGLVDRPLALAHARRLTQEHGDQAEVWTWLAGLAMDGGDRVAAFEAYRQAAARDLTVDAIFGLMRADPDRAYATAAQLADDVTDDETLGALAKVALRSGRAEDTMAALLRAHERDPSDNEWMTAMVALDPKRAVDVLGRTAREYRGDSQDEVVGAYGNALREVGRMEEAFEQYREAYDIDPGDWEWQRGLARSDPGRAVGILEARWKEVGDEGDLVGALADAYAGLGERRRAMELYERALDLGGGDEWYARMARVDPDVALVRLRALTETQPGSADAWGALGDLHRELGNESEAREAYGEARRFSPTHLLWEIRWREMGG